MDMGWIKLHRAIRRNWIWDDGNKLKWWLDLLLQANHSDRKICVGNDILLVKRGSIHTSILKLSKSWDIDKKTVKKFLDLLEKDSMISFTSSKIGTTIILSNYNEFQGFYEDESPALSPTSSPSKPLQCPNTMDNTMDNNMANTVESSVPNPKDIPLESSVNLPRVNTVDNSMDISVDTNNNYNNINNSNNSEKWGEGRECGEGKVLEKLGKCVQEEPSPPAVPLLNSFPSLLHEELFKSFGEIAYQTWFVDAVINDSSSEIILKVDSKFKFNVINQRFKLPLEQILGKRVNIVE